MIRQRVASGGTARRLPRELDVACHLNVMLPGIGFEAGAAHPGLEPVLAELSELGYRRVVMPPVDPERCAAAQFGAVCRQYGLVAIPIASQAPGANVASGASDERAAGLALLRRMVDFTVELGGDQLNGVPYGLFERASAATTPDAFARAAAAVGEAAEYANERGVTITFEVLNRYETSMLNTAEQAMAFAEASGSPHLGIHLDTFHMLVEESDIAAAIRCALPRLRFLELGQSGRGPLDAGSLDLVGVVSDAITAGYTGRWGVEAFSAAVLPEAARAALAIWREPFDNGITLARDAAHLIERGAADVRSARHEEDGKQ